MNVLLGKCIITCLVKRKLKVSLVGGGTKWKENLKKKLQCVWNFRMCVDIVHSAELEFRLLMITLCPHVLQEVEY